MERLAIEIGVVIVVFILGYWSGFRACFDYLMEEEKEHRHEQDISHDLGPDYRTK